MDALAPAYGRMLAELNSEEVPLLQIEEPALVFGEDPAAVKRAGELYAEMARGKKGRWILQTYFGHLAEHWDELLTWPFDVLGLDLVREPRNRKLLEKATPLARTLAVGIVSGRAPWKTELQEAGRTLRWLQERGLLEGAMLQPSTSLLHLPYTVQAEEELDPEVKSWLAFGDERLRELQVLKRLINDGSYAFEEAVIENNRLFAAMRKSRKIHRPRVNTRLAKLNAKHFRREVPFARRYAHQMKELKLPAWPTTTIGSFPQTPEVRQARQDFKLGRLKPDEYKAFINSQIRDVIDKQEAMGLDVLVHGEFERTDMVEFFGQRMDGFAHTQNGWVQSYGTRYVRPPIIYGDIVRPQPMTTRETFFAQKLTSRPVKGMMSGPITILQWSFVREDIPREKTAYQIALCLRDECRHLEQGGIRVIQVDEPALREGLPLKKADQPDYLRWAVRAFRLATSGVKASTQIHTHMCYGDFSDIIKEILALDADVISLENARSHDDLLSTFSAFRYNHGIGPGVYDIHSPAVPPVEGMVERLRAAARLIDPKLLWVNPDCGLKTRGWKETLQSLNNMVQAAKALR